MMISSWLASFCPFFLQQETQHLLFKSDKAYTLLIVMLIIWLGVLGLLFRLDRRLSKIEKQSGANKSS